MERNTSTINVLKETIRKINMLKMEWNLKTQQEVIEALLRLTLKNKVKK